MNIGNIFLIGPMGSGKMAVGRQLSRLLAMQFYDSDAKLSALLG
jgi:shikimate kinase